jgi:hypothetical protein
MYSGEGVCRMREDLHLRWLKPTSPPSLGVASIPEELTKNTPVASIRRTNESPNSNQGRSESGKNLGFDLVIFREGYINYLALWKKRSLAVPEESYLNSPARPFIDIACRTYSPIGSN